MGKQGNETKKGMEEKVKNERQSDTDEELDGWLGGETNGGKISIGGWMQGCCEGSKGPREQDSREQKGNQKERWEVGGNEGETRDHLEGGYRDETLTSWDNHMAAEREESVN